MTELAKLCKILDIEPPKIIGCNDINLFPTKTTIAVSQIIDNTIFLNNNFLPTTTFDEIFAIAHECRHFWQFKNNKIDFTNYLTSDNLTKNDYNIQPAELDAHAFACAYMIKIYNVKPLFLGISEKIKKDIYKAADKIIIK